MNSRHLSQSHQSLHDSICGFSGKLHMATFESTDKTVLPLLRDHEEERIISATRACLLPGGQHLLVSPGTQDTGLEQLSFIPVVLRVPVLVSVPVLSFQQERGGAGCPTPEHVCPVHPCADRARCDSGLGDQQRLRAHHQEALYP